MRCFEKIYGISMRQDSLFMNPVAERISRDLANGNFEWVYRIAYKAGTNSRDLPGSDREGL